MPTFELEQNLLQKGYKAIVGVDEAGRGAWAGPLYAGAVVIAPENAEHFIDVTDSKKLSAQKREELFAIITKNSTAWAVGFVTAEEIDTLGLTKANQTACERAIAGLSHTPDYALLDGRLEVSQIPFESIVKGDSLSFSIAAASILAKVSRDHEMLNYHLQYPEYCFNEHVGYGTKKHQQALAQHGVLPIHRKSYAPIRALLQKK
ncbi:MAG: ribonuclease HII [Candidatus Jacksonbacteria bacterium]|nr:ribonuclease HII [Candidatus Jacksonbacteria bacterium]MBT6756933.1 ribonuclease HII [Candidatus Jacksonbacteria bacterium]MBT6955424.1 ribonuclease HII [Candidatus Jacksonbacteria bacterium]MBT7007935.1 ribonuclease HII [Candidatus Jacksonbacteria bacterium]MBT7338627.1 ribonuclease HII [Candidatus Jacksonbacteria bacterium]